MRGEGNTLRHQKCENMRTVRNITVAVTPELYRQTRMLAAEYDSTVTALVAYLLQRLPKALKAARFPAGGPQAAAPAKPAQPASSTAATSAMPPSPSAEKTVLSACTVANQNLTPSVSMASEDEIRQNTAPVRQYASTSTLTNTFKPGYMQTPNRVQPL